MLERIDTSGAFIHVKCRRELRTASKKFKTCLLCKKNLHKAPRIGSSAACVELESEMQYKIVSFRKRSGYEVCINEYRREIHKVCLDDFKEGHYTCNSELTPEKAIGGNDVTSSDGTKSVTRPANKDF